MKRILILACGLAAIASAATLVRAQPGAVTAIRAARLFDGTSDSGVSPHGRNAEEFSLLVEHGLPPAAALRTSVTAATRLGVERLTGTIEAGKEADIVAVPGDGLRNIIATERVRFVMKDETIVRHAR